MLREADPGDAAEVRALLEHALAAQATPQPAALADRIAAQFGADADPRVTLTERAAGASGFVERTVERLSKHSARCGRYEYQGEVARGGQGVVMRVWDEDLRRELAMKIILAGEDAPSSGDANAASRTLGRFLEEAQVTGQLDHPGIVPVHELGLDQDGRVYFTMKLVRGRDLDVIFKLAREEEQDWNQTRVLGVLLKLSEAMAYAHAKGVIHRDLKPANVMVGKFGEVYAMDWGLARIAGQDDGKDLRLQPELTSAAVLSPRRDDDAEDAGSPLLTMDGDVMGTPAYMSPEQARGDLPAMGPHSDVYALGAMLYQLLAGHMPYVKPGMRMTAHGIWYQVQAGPPEALDSMAPGAPAELIAICERAMAREVSQRYADMSELGADLRAYLEHRVVQAYEGGAVAELRKWVVRNRGLAAAASLAFLLGAVGLVSTVWVQRAGNSRLERQVTVSDAVNGFLTEDILAAAMPTGDERGGRAMLEMLDVATARVDEAAASGGRFEQMPLVEASIRLALGRTYLVLDKFELGRRHLERAYALRRDQLGAEDPLTLRAGYFRARSMNRRDERLEFVEQILEDQRRILGNEHPDTVATALDVVYLLGLRHPEQSEALLSELAGAVDSNAVLEIGAANNMGIAHLRQGELEQALAEFEELTRRSEELLGVEHELTLNALANQGQALRELERHGEAISILERVRTLNLRVRGEGALNTVRASVMLAQAYRAAGRPAESDQVLASALAAARVSLGADHALTLRVINNIGMQHLYAGHFEAAILLFDELLRVTEGAHGAGSEGARIARSNLVCAMNAAKDLPVASRELALELALEIATQSGEARGPAAAGTITALGAAQVRLGRFAEAELTLWDSIERSDGLNLEAKLWLAACLDGTGYEEDAKALIEEVRGVIEAGEDDGDAAWNAGLLARIEALIAE